MCKRVRTRDLSGVFIRIEHIKTAAVGRATVRNNVLDYTARVFLPAMVSEHYFCSPRNQELRSDFSYPTRASYDQRTLVRKFVAVYSSFQTREAGLFLRGWTNESLHLSGHSWRRHLHTDQAITPVDSCDLVGQCPGVVRVRNGKIKFREDGLQTWTLNADESSRSENHCNLQW